MGERLLLEAFSELIYGHMEHDGREVAIESRAWRAAAKKLEAEYPLLAEIMRKTQQKEYRPDGPSGERMLEADLAALDESNDLF